MSDAIIDTDNAGVIAAFVVIADNIDVDNAGEIIATVANTDNVDVDNAGVCDRCYCRKHQ